MSETGEKKLNHVATNYSSATIYIYIPNINFTNTSDVDSPAKLKLLVKAHQ